ncbi:hypothetical protein OLZ13_25970, partial [Escherichia coli]|nr:hypothetical protein [Escherichia coli]
MTNREEWLSAKNCLHQRTEITVRAAEITCVTGREKKTEQRRMKKTLSALIRAEKTAEKAAAAKARVTAIIAAERKAAARAERKAR